MTYLKVLNLFVKISHRMGQSELLTAYFFLNKELLFKRMFSVSEVHKGKKFKQFQVIKCFLNSSMTFCPCHYF
uniref:Uncharacterized protein n=1 Tax=Anguilla anguilla TaxID=7936 RepID=A0A0E9X5Z6_ANGAN